MTVFGGCRVGGVATHTMFVNGDLEGKFIMDRNLGARDTKRATDGKGVLYYQFGRKDPFPGGISSTLTTAYKSSGGTENIWTIINQSIGTGVAIEKSINSPMIYYGGSIGNWSSDVSSVSYVWLDYEADVDRHDKSIFDPSPKGWKVSQDGTWGNDGEKNAFSTTTMTDFGTTDDTYGCCYPRGDNPFAFYPSTGYRASGSGNLALFSGYSCVWSSTPSSATYSIQIQIGTTYVRPSSHGGHRASGHSIRPVQHDE